MTINTGISSSSRRPQTFHRFLYQQGGRSLVPLPQKILLVGISKGGNAVANAIYPIADAQESATLFGSGQQLDLMLRKAFDQCAAYGQGPQIFGCGLAEPAGAARTATITVTGTATTSGTVVVRIAGRTYTIGVATGDTPTAIAAALNTAINADRANLPLTSAAAVGVVTTTHNAIGVGGNDVVVEVMPVSTAPGSVAVAYANGVAGSGVASIVTALANAAGPDFDAIAIGNHAAQDIADALAAVTTAWTATEKKWRWIIVGEPGTIGTATALATAANDRAIVVINANGTRSMPGEIAACGAVALTAKSRPNGNWDGQRVLIYPPDDANAYTNTQVETALAAGITPLTPFTDANTRVTQQGVMRIEKYVTTATNVSGQPFEVLRDIAVPRVGAYMARQVDAAYAARFGADANPDGVLLDGDTVLRIRDMVTNLMLDAQDQRILQNVTADLAKLIVEVDSAAPGRVNVDVTYTVVLGLHQVAFVHRVTVGG